MVAYLFCVCSLKYIFYSEIGENLTVKFNKISFEASKRERLEIICTNNVKELANLKETKAI